MTFDARQGRLAMNRRLCFIGDSHVNGTGDSEYLGWPGRLMAWAHARGHSGTYYNLGIRWNTSEDIAARWRSEVDARIDADHEGYLAFSFGANDCVTYNGARRVPHDRTLATSESVLTEAVRVCPALMIGPNPIDNPSINDRIEAVSSALATTCRRIGVPYLPTFEALRASPVWMQEVRDNDGAHPGPAGYEILAEHIDAWTCWREWFP